MTTEIVNRSAGELNTSAAEILTGPTSGTIQLAEWAQELQAAYQIARALANSSFLPMSLRMKSKNTPKTEEELTNDAAAVILAGKSVGFDPLQAAQNIFPVHGMPSMYARSMSALVISQGHEVMRGEATDDSVTWHARRKGGHDWQSFTWTIARAKKAGYTSNPKYQSDPIAMLGAKALAEACRTVFPDVLLGMAYSVEELELEDMGERPSRPARTPRAVEASPGQETVGAPATITQTQWNELKKAGATAGLDAKYMGALAADVTGIQLTGWKDIPADRYDDILQAVTEITQATQTEDEEGVA